MWAVYYLPTNADTYWVRLFLARTKAAALAKQRAHMRRFFNDAERYWVLNEGV